MWVRLARISTGTALSVLLVGLLLPAQSPTLEAAARSRQNTFSGRAEVVRVRSALINVDLADTGPLPSSGGALEQSLLTVSVPNVLTAEVGHAATIGHGNASRSEASVANLNLTLAGNSIRAGFLMSRAQATCGPNGATASGSSEIVGLRINGQSIVVSGQPNQTIDLPLNAGQVIINEQDSAGPGDITVNALHVVVNGVADVVISSAHADIVCRACVADTGDFVTGGGWITGPAGAKANFGVAGGIKNNGGLWGHLVYIDHRPSMKVKGTGVTDYIVVTSTTRIIQGTATINGASGFTYEVEVTDAGEPGRNDSFRITLSNGYSASGLLEGGNIQIHNGKCS